VPDAEYRAGDAGRGGFGQHPAQRRLKHPPERGLLPGDGTDRDAQQYVVGELAPVQAGDPQVVEQGAGGWGQRGEPACGPIGRRRGPVVQ
jgi:hypothetical protein